MNNLGVALTEAIENLVADQTGDNVKEIVEVWESNERDGGGCPTCSYDTTVMQVEYRDSQGVPKTYTYYGTFAELISALTEEWVKW